uniref:Uncharacterized protein LOC113794922 isoform X1 n=1 Tax=Dermatophagoides pteronyssinus TaxID=6956 RepID=A0A6P6Y7A6_DERPT|nr:uncharacterized protein LOC113794922 isoform X1 [Dermatophagoides pteronyssinus]
MPGGNVRAVPWEPIQPCLAGTRSNTQHTHNRQQNNNTLIAIVRKINACIRSMLTQCDHNVFVAESLDIQFSEQFNRNDIILHSLNIVQAKQHPNIGKSSQGTIIFILNRGPIIVMIDHSIAFPFHKNFIPIIMIVM